jgi:hypothetical protein
MKRGFLGSRSVRAMLWSERQPGSGCGRSILQSELTLTATKPPISQTAGDAVNVGEAMCSGHLRCDLVGPGRTTGPCQARLERGVKPERDVPLD